MKDETYNRLFELSFKTLNRLATPLILDYYSFEGLGVSESRILNLIENKCNPLLS